MTEQDIRGPEQAQTSTLRVESIVAHAQKAFALVEGEKMGPTDGIDFITPRLVRTAQNASSSVMDFEVKNLPKDLLAQTNDYFRAQQLEAGTSAIIGFLWKSQGKTMLVAAGLGDVGISVLRGKDLKPLRSTDRSRLGWASVSPTPIFRELQKGDIVLIYSQTFDKDAIKRTSFDSRSIGTSASHLVRESLRKSKFKQAVDTIVIKADDEIIIHKASSSDPSFQALAEEEKGVESAAEPMPVGGTAQDAPAELPEPVIDLSDIASIAVTELPAEAYAEPVPSVEPPAAPEPAAPPPPPPADGVPPEPPPAEPAAEPRPAPRRARIVRTEGRAARAFKDGWRITKEAWRRAFPARRPRTRREEVDDVVRRHVNGRKRANGHREAAAWRNALTRRALITGKWLSIAAVGAVPAAVVGFEHARREADAFRNGIPTPYGKFYPMYEPENLSAADIPDDLDVLFWQHELDSEDYAKTGWQVLGDIFKADIGTSITQGIDRNEVLEKLARNGTKIILVDSRLGTLSEVESILAPAAELSLLILGRNLFFRRGVMKILGTGAAAWALSTPIGWTLSTLAGFGKGESSHGLSRLNGRITYVHPDNINIRFKNALMANQMLAVADFLTWDPKERKTAKSLKFGFGVDTVHSGVEDYLREGIDESGKLILSHPELVHEGLVRNSGGGDNFLSGLILEVPSNYTLNDFKNIQRRELVKKTPIRDRILAEALASRLGIRLGHQ